LVAAITRTSILRVRPAPSGRISLLQDTQQLDLKRGRNLADLVEEDRATIGALEQADMIVDGAGKRALLVAEQLGFEQFVGQRAAVFDHERLVPAQRPVTKQRAASSLPVPEPPISRTGTSNGATCASAPQTSSIGLPGARTIPSFTS
jgi:hypothetical protein